MSAQMKTELLLTCEDRLGVFAEILSMLSDNGINLLGYVGYTMDDRAFIHLVPEDSNKACELMEEHGCKVQMSEIIYATFDDKIGSGMRLAKLIADAEINLFHSYATSSGSDTFGAVISTSDNEKVLSLLRG